MLHEYESTEGFSAISVINDIINEMQAYHEDTENILTYIATSQNLWNVKKVDTFPLSIEKELYEKSPYYYDFQDVFAIVSSSIVQKSELETNFIGQTSLNIFSFVKHHSHPAAHENP